MHGAGGVAKEEGQQCYGLLSCSPARAEAGLGFRALSLSFVCTSVTLRVKVLG